jgi:MFS family permease
VFGALADVIDRKRVFIMNLGVMLLGSLCLASLDTRLFWPFLILFGLGWGGLYTMLQVLTIDCFGLKCAGKVLGTITVLDALGGGLGPWITGVIYDQTGSYRLAFMLVVVLVALALVAATVVRTQRKPA